MSIIKILWIFCILSLLEGCDLVDHRRFHDPTLKLTQQDYEKITKPNLQKKEVPPFHPRIYPLSKAPLLTPAMEKKVSVTFSESVPLKEAFMELGRQVGVGMAINSQVAHEQEGILYSADRRSFIDVIKDICLITGLRFQIEENRILIEPDDPYLVTYHVEFLNQTRKSENRISVSTDVFSPLESQSRTDNGSESLLVGISLVDFWSELEKNLKVILSLEGRPSGKSPSNYALHKQAGLVIVSGTAKQHLQINNYLKKLKEAITAQIIIEAKILEVTLDQEYKSGINWSQLGGDVHLTVPLGSLSSPRVHNEPHHPTRDVFTFAVEHEKFSAILNLVKKFGTVRTLSNPRLTVMNNQPAMLKVATNEVFFHLEFERYFQSEGKPDVENISSDAMTVPIGLVMIVQPSVNFESGEIMMALRPTISRVQKEVEDPAVAIKSHQKVKSSVPVVQVRELDSVLKMQSGQILVMGGLMEDRASYESASVPLFDSIPFFGELARGKDDDRKITELVIFLTAHIVDEPYIDEADEKIYNTYSEDPRPLQF